MTEFKTYISDYIEGFGLSDSVSKLLLTAVLVAVLIIILFIADFIARKFLLRAFSKFAEKTKSDFDDILILHKAHRNIAHIVPLILTLWLLPIVFEDYPTVKKGIQQFLKILTILVLIRTCRAILITFKDYFKTFPSLKDKPIHSYIQVVMIFLWVIGIAYIFVVLTGIQLITFFTTIGTASAVLMLVFKDTILGFVASIQIAANDTIRIGDWIAMPKFGADGTVIDINLTSVQVQNFDYTVTSIPTYALISEAFVNYRGMQESGGRRIKRSIIIKSSTVRFLEEAEVDELKSIQLISSYLDTRQSDIDVYNKRNEADKSTPINGRNLTNLGVFRKYIESYIETQSAINKDMIIMTRQLQPTSQGIPLELYAFSKDKRWENYEYIMSNIFDHVIASVPYFHLELFELPNTGNFPN